MPAFTDNFNNASSLNELFLSEVANGELRSSGESGYAYGRASSIDLAIDSPTGFRFLTSKKAGGTNARLRLSSDNATWRNNGWANNTVGAYDFDGVNDFISTAFVPPQANTGNTLEVCSWVKIDNTATWQDIFSTDNGSFDWGLQVINNQFRFTNGIGFVDTGIPADTDWHFICCQWIRNTGFKLWIDNVLRYTNASCLGNSSSFFYFGKDTDGTRYFNGKIGETFAYTRALTSAERTNLYLYGIHPAPNNLGGHWRFYTNANDDGGSYNGTVNGATNLTGIADIPQVGYSLVPSTGGAATPYFDGTNDTLGVSGVIVTGTCTVEIWVKPDPTIAYPGIIGIKGPSSSDYVQAFLGDPNDPNIYVSVGNPAGGGLTLDSYTTDNPLSFNQWNLITFTKTSGKMDKIYCNGVESATGTQSILDGCPEQYTIGFARDNGSPFWLRGKIAAFSVFNRIRTSGEIYTGFINGYVNTGDASCVHYFPLDTGYDDLIGGVNGVNNGSTLVIDPYRPITVTPTSGVVPVSGASSLPAFYYQVLFDSPSARSTYALNTLSFDAQPSSGGGGAPRPRRPVILMRRF